MPTAELALRLLLTGGTIYASPTESPIKDGVVVIRDGKIAAVGPRGSVRLPDGVPAVDCSGLLLAAMRKAKVVLIPTLKIWKYQLRHDRASLGESRAQNGVGQLRAWVASGGVVLFGTDVGGMDDYDPSDEYALMAEAGMTFLQLLASLTTAPAEKFGEAGRLGRIAPGLAADLVVLNGDPSRNVRAFAALRYTIRDGKVIYRAAH